MTSRLNDAWAECVAIRFGRRIVNMKKGKGCGVILTVLDGSAKEWLDASPTGTPTCLPGLTD